MSSTRKYTQPSVEELSRLRRLAQNDNAPSVRIEARQLLRELGEPSDPKIAANPRLRQALGYEPPKAGYWNGSRYCRPTLTPAEARARLARRL